MQKITLTNSYDEEDVTRGHRKTADVRSTEIEALVDTGATMMVLPADAVSRLGLLPAGYRKVRYADGRVAEVPWVSGIRITILGRDTVINALVEAAGTTPLIGQIPLEELDLLVDPKSRELRVNPASPDAPLLDLLSAA
ncbi:MAG TPA: aspartyl protease family protein [Polyangia bacterium]|jgi:clan AA aspartic protease|nr:aspartyl protease family protein [Polyangia bacterium]